MEPAAGAPDMTNRELPAAWGDAPLHVKRYFQRAWGRGIPASDPA